MKQPPELRPWLAGIANPLPVVDARRLDENHVGCRLIVSSENFCTDVAVLALFRKLMMTNAV